MRFAKYFVFSALLIMVGIVYSREVPILKRWLLNKIYVISKQQTSLEFKAEKISFSLFPPSVEFDNISITPMEKSLAEVLYPTKIDSIEVSLSPTALISGRFEIGKIFIKHPVTSVFIKNSKKNHNAQDSNKKLALPLNGIIDLPVRKIIVRDADIQAKIDPAQLYLKLTKFGINFEKSSNAARVEIFSPHALIKKFNNEKSLTEMGLATRIIVENQAAEVSAIKISSGQSFIMARGIARGPVLNLDWNHLSLRTIAHIDVPDILGKVQEFVKLDTPTLKGILNFELLASYKRGSTPLGALQIETQDLKINQFNIGNILSKINFSKNIFTTDSLKVNNSAGQVLLKDFTFSLNEDSKFSGRVQTDSLELKQLLTNLGVPTTPLHFETFLKAACEGSYLPTVKMECAGEVGGKNLKVQTPELKTIAAVKDIKIVTRFLLENMRMNFPTGEIAFGQSRGRGQGYVDFNNGFNFDFQTDSLNFSDIESLAGLKYEGSVALDGNTQGNGSTAKILTHIDTKQFWFENFGLDNLNADLRFEKSKLYFDNINGHFTNSPYKGNLVLNLDNGEIQSKMDFPKLSLADLAKLFSRKSQFNFKTEGFGSATLEASGPTDLSKLTYNLKSQFNSGLVYGETFQNLIFNVHGIKGHAYADSVTAKKGDGSLVLKGDITSNGIMSLFIKGQDLHLSDFENIKSLMPSLDGKIQLDISLQDKILDPKMSLRSFISQATISQERIEDSNFSMDISPDSIKLAAQLLNNQVSAALVQPKNKKSPFSFKLEANNWDFSPFLSQISGSEYKKDYETNLSIKSSLVSESGNFWESTGEIKASAFYVKHGNIQMENLGPLDIKFNGGLVNIENFKIVGDNTDLSISGSRNKKSALNLNINGQMELGLFTFLTPFFKDMRGNLKINSQIVGTTDKPEFLGTAQINKALFKLKEFPHAFEDINSDLIFSQSKIVVNSLKGSVGGGELLASGSVTLRALRDIPVEISGNLTKATLNIPSGLTTKGSGEFSISGNWFPYTLHADYVVDSGVYTKNFGDQENSILLKRSAFLPKIMQQKEATTLDLDLNVNIPKSVSVKNSLLEAEVKGSLSVKGDPQYSILTGELSTLPNGKFYFRDTPFTLSVGKTKFNNPNENNPNSYAVGTARVRDWDINLVYQGNLDKYELKLTSSPPLQEKSIISLLALGITDDNLEKNKSSDQLALQGYQAGSVILQQNPLIKDFKKKSGVTVRLSQTVDDTRNTVMPKFVAEKQWSPKFSTSIGRTFGERSSRDFSAEYRFNKNISILGSYEQRDYDQFSVSTSTGTASTSSATSTAQSATTTNVLGIDLQYQADFK